MASVRSLGLHQPSGLQHAIDEQILPPNPPASLYEWETYPSLGSDEDGEDELLTTSTCVIWSRGGVYQTTYSFELEKEPITKALLAFFPASPSRNNPVDGLQSGAASDGKLEKTLVVILKTQAHLYSLTGTNHVVHLPFEVQTACAAPVGILLQRKQRSENLAPLALKFPKVPPESFMSSQLSFLTSSQQTNFSVETLGNPKAMNLGQSLTIENTWDRPAEEQDSHWPRLVCLMDPLSEIGLVVTDKEAANNTAPKAKSAARFKFLDPAEEILHIEEVKIAGSAESVTLAITSNSQANMYTIWRLSYLDPKDPFIGQNNKAQEKASRRRSSMAPNAVAAAHLATPSQPGYHRESFGAPLPGKRQRKSEKIEKSDTALDLVSSLEQQNQDDGVTRRSSRRVSSMLARADLSASHERASFTEQQLGSTFGNPSRRSDPYGGRQARLSSSQAQQIHPSLGSLLEAPFDAGLDEGFNKMGLNDRDLDGLQREIHMEKVHSFERESSTARYSFTNKSSSEQPKVFILQAPPFATNKYRRGQLLVGIQNAPEKRLQLVVLYLRAHPQQEGGAQPRARGDSKPSSLNIIPGELRNAQNVVDSCKLVDGEQSAILILSESGSGQHELSTQAPWGELTKVSLSVLFVDDERELQFRGRKIDRDVKQRKSEVMDLADGSIVGVRQPRRHGVVDVLDASGRFHQLRLQLRPTSPQARKVLDTCRSVLPDSVGERVHAGWLHTLQWLQRQEEDVLDQEWSALVTMLLALTLNLGRADGKALQVAKVPVRQRRPASGSFSSIKESDDWRSMERAEASNALGCPPWVLNSAWDWALDEESADTWNSTGDQFPSQNFITRHVALAREFLASPAGESALGASGYLPTSLGKPMEARVKNLSDLIMGLHLLLEEQKLDITTPEYLSPGRASLRAVLCQMVRWLKWKDFLAIYELGLHEEVDPRNDAELVLKPAIPQPSRHPPDLLGWIQMRLTSTRKEHYITARDIFYASARLPENDRSLDHRWDAVFPRTFMFKRFFKLVRAHSNAVQMVENMRECGISPYVLETLPEAVLVPLRDAISLCQPHPPTGWSTDLLDLVNRTDISLLLKPGQKPRASTSNILAPTHRAGWDFKMLCQSLEETNGLGYDEGEGTERQAVIRALFKDDRRLNEAQDLLSTHKARIVRLDPQPNWQESEYLEKQKELVSRVATGTLAIPAGRGLLYYGLRYPLLTQKFHIGGFNLNCVVKPANVTVGVDKTLFTEEKVNWGFFHQGVAAGLAISPQAKGIDTSWILYNKPGTQPNSTELSNRHAGFLLALGLNGHLKDVAKWVAFKYLTPKHTMTSVGLLLGLAASYMGTMDSLITRLLSVHATRMLPRGAAELNLNAMTQTSGIMGIGLLYANSQHRRMSEIMLSEIEHIEEDDEEDPLRSECYRLAAGFALGFINLGKGADLKGLHDMRVTEKLVAHATATKNVDIVHVLDRAAAGAVMAISLIFMKSEDQIVARKIDVPESVLQFDYVRPDILLLRTVAKNVIMWSKIEPTTAWIQKSLPSLYRPRSKLHGTTKLKSTDLPFFSILAGICFSIALRFSGSASPKVRDLLLHYLDQFMRIARIPSTSRGPTGMTPPYDEELARTNARMCQDVLALSVSIVMAGTGDIPVLRRLRALHGRDDPDVPYGSHLAAHLAIGALFLGCGTVTFGTSNQAIAALLISFYPMLPTSVGDNRSHLQAFRHFWVLATEQRCLVAKDVINGQPVSVSVQVNMRKGISAEPVLYRTTPCLLPPLDQIASVSTVCGPQFWDVHIDLSNEEVREAFTKNQSIYLRRRPPRDSAFSSTLGALGADSQSEKSPFRWLFGLDGLRGVSYAEREAILENAEQDQETGRSVDARLEMERGIFAGGDRERLQGAKLVFEWEASRERLLQASSHGDQQGRDGEESKDEGGVWWMRGSVIEDLKGKVWLAAREAEN